MRRVFLMHKLSAFSFAPQVKTRILTGMNLSTLQTTAKAMVAPGKGILAADESSGTCQKRFDSVNVPCTEENRRAYRDLFLAAPGIEQYLSGVILHDETIRQSALDGTPFPKLLAGKGILPGIK